MPEQSKDVLSRAAALENLQRLHGRHAELSSILERARAGAKQATAQQLEAFKNELYELHDRISLALSIYREAAHDQEAKDSDRLQRTLKTWAIIVGIATLVQAAIAVATYFRGH